MWIHNFLSGNFRFWTWKLLKYSWNHTWIKVQMDPHSIGGLRFSTNKKNPGPFLGLENMWLDTYYYIEWRRRRLTTNFTGRLYCYSVALHLQLVCSCSRGKQSNFLAVEYFHSIYISWHCASAFQPVVHFIPQFWLERPRHQITKACNSTSFFLLSNA